MLRQMHIFDRNAVNFELWNAYIANALINMWGLPFTFYEINLLLEHQNGKFKEFQLDQGLSL